MKFTITNLLLGLTVIALCLGWYMDRTTLNDEEYFRDLCLSVTRQEHQARISGVSALREHGGVHVLPPLMYALGDPSLDVAVKARLALEELTGKSFRPDSNEPASSSELLAEWGLWIDWYADEYQHEESRAPPLFDVCVQNSMQKTEFGKINAR